MVFKGVLLGMACLCPAMLQAELATVHARMTAVDSGKPRVSWTLKAAGDARGIVQTGYEVRVASGASLLGQGRADLWESGRVASASMSATYAGAPLPEAAPIFWQVRAWETASGHAKSEVSPWSAVGSVATGIKTWSGRWIAATPDAPAGATLGIPNDQRLPLFRRTVLLRARPVEALLFISGLGQFTARINGKDVTHDVLTPGWTDYRKHILYDIYDVRDLLTQGQNALAVLLGNGMYNALEVPGRYSKFSGSYGQPKLLAELHLRYPDGTREVVCTDKNWRTAPGPITFSNAYGGEDFDPRLEPVGWDGPSFDDASWSPAIEVASPGGTLVADRTPPIRMTQRFVPMAVTNPRQEVTVYDLGQNFAGWPMLTVTGPPGAQVYLLPGELLDKRGLVTQRSANASPEDPAAFRYTVRGTGESESWHPQFSYYGFRYVQVQVSDPAVKIAALTGEAIRANAPLVGHFSSSDDLLDRIHRLILGAVNSNMVSVLTDCPHREKLGWLEQTHLFATSLMLNYDVSALYEKMADDMSDAQDASGLVPSIAPEVTKFVDKEGRSTDFRDSPEWGSAMILSPWAAYGAYGDPTPLREHYEAMQRYVTFLQAKTRGGLLDYGLGDWYDIGPGPPGYAKLTSKRVTATGTLYEDLVAMAGVATVLGEEADAGSYRKQAEAVRAAFNEALFHPVTNQYDRGSQTANAMPLALGIVPEGARAAVMTNLVRDIEAHGYHVTAGDVGFHYVVRALTDGGRSDVLAKMLAVTTSPSYGYQLSRGATTLTEAWDTNPNSSQNHFMLGHAEEWFYRGLAGIDVDLSRPAGEQIHISPFVPEGMGHAEASIQTAVGMVASAWTATGEKVSVDITIPPNSIGVVTLPAGFRAWTEARKSMARVARLGSGTYHFVGSR